MESENPVRVMLVCLCPEDAADLALPPHGLVSACCHKHKQATIKLASLLRQGHPCCLFYNADPTGETLELRPLTPDSIGILAPPDGKIPS